MALITLAEAKAHLNITSSATDAEVQSFVTVACELVQGYADRTWDIGSAVESFDGGGDTILLRQSPITSITSVVVDGTTLAAANYDSDLANGIIRTITPTTEGVANVVVTYAVGDASPPALAKHAALETVRHLWATQRGTVARNPMNGDEYIPGLAFSLPRRVMELLDPIRNVG